MARTSRVCSYVFGLAILAAPPAQAKDDWVEVRSEHFRVFSNAGEKRALQTASHFEQLRSLFTQVFPNQLVDSPVLTEIFVFKNEKSMKPYQPLVNGEPDNLVAYSRYSSYKNTIGMRLGGSGETSRQRAFHQFIHLVMSYGDTRYPVWFREGLAEYYETTIIRKDHARVGKIKEAHLRTLNSLPHIPLEKLFAVDQESPYYVDPDRRAHFDAESWALIHYLMVDKVPEGTRQLNEYFRLLALGRKLAFQEAFQRNPREMDNELRNYIDNRIYQYFKVSLQPLDAKNELAASQLSAASTKHHLGDLLASIERYDEAEQQLTESIEDDPELKEVYSSLGFLYLRREKYDMARDYLALAVQNETDSPIVHNEYAQLLLGPYLGRTVNSIPDEVMEPVTASLEHVLATAPELIDAARLLAFVYLVRNENLERATDVAETALERAPGNQRLLYVLGQLYVKTGHYGDAAKVFAHLLKNEEDPQTIAQLRRRLDWAEVQLARSGGSSPATSSSPVEMPDAHSDQAPAEEISGILSELDCSLDEGLLFSISSGQRVFLLRTDKPPALRLFENGEPAKKMTLGCGVQNNPVRARYTPSPPSSELEGYAVDGKLLEIDFVKN